MWCAPGGALRSAAMVLTFALVGCSGGGGKADGTLRTAPPTSVAATTTTVAVTTTVAESTTTSTCQFTADTDGTTANNIPYVAGQVVISTKWVFREVPSSFSPEPSLTDNVMHGDHAGADPVEVSARTSCEAAS